MANAARLLLGYFREWDGDVNAAPERRTPNLGRDMWLGRARAVGYLSDIEESMAAMEAADPSLQIEMYREALLPCYQALFGYAPQWGSNVGRVSLLDNGDLRALQMLAAYLDATEHASLEEGQRRSLIATLSETLAEVAHADYLEAATKGYLGSLLSDAILALSEGSEVSDWSSRKRALEAGGALQAAAATVRVPDDKRSWLREQAAIITTAVIVAAANETTVRVIEAGAKVAEALSGSGPS